MNILIPIGTGSCWQDNELRFCLRSIEKHLTGWYKIIIVGRLPDWIKQNDRLVFIQAKDRSGAVNKEANIHRKILAGINYGIGESFLFMNDDHFLLQNFEVYKFPYHHKGLLSDTIKSINRANAYYKTLRQTLISLPGKPYNWDTHCPIIYESEKYTRSIKKDLPPFGYGLKTIYCERNKVIGSFYPDLKLGFGSDYDIKDRLYFSIGNKAVCAELEFFLKELYPFPSQFE